MEFTKVGMQTFIALGTGAVLFFTVPLVIALIWCMKKKERFSTVLAGAATFFTVRPGPGKTDPECPAFPNGDGNGRTRCQPVLCGPSGTAGLGRGPVPGCI